MVKKRKKTGSITRRWVFGNLLLIAVILLLAELAAMVFVRQSYYNSVEQAISYRIQTLERNLPSVSLSASERAAALRVYVEEFVEKDKFELMLLNHAGVVTVTSSGFAAEDSIKPDDYTAALFSADGRGTYTGYTSQGEHVTAVTRVLVSPIGEISAVRFVTSLTKIDAQLKSLALISSALVIIVLAFTFASGVYFIRSIVIPVKEVADSARDIASGNFDVRINVNRDDEIGDLCGRINEMAAGLSKADKMKNDFISSVSHELRTPLTSIRGWGETLLSVDPAERETYNKGMRIILSETQRLSSMVEDLLDFSRMQTGSMSVSLAPSDLVAELTDAVIAVEQRARRAGIRIRYDEPARAVAVIADRNRMRQVFANILDNAIKYSSPGGEIAVSVRRKDGHAYVTVRDSGKGIPPDELSKVKSRFYKASNSTTGSGIGLAVVDEIMRLHGGSFDIQSELGTGTTVKLGFNLYSRTKGN